MDDFQQMRSYIVATEPFVHDIEDAEQPLTEAVAAPDTLLEDLENIIFKLRAFMESSGGDYAFGVETGMARAADMIENALKRRGE
jgi:hypothetical protein